MIRLHILKRNILRMWREEFPSLDGGRYNAYYNCVVWLLILKPCDLVALLQTGNTGIL
jgi:hypothetical protein